MVYSYTIPIRDRLIILANLMLVMIVNIFMWHISNVLIVPFLVFMGFEVLITGILWRWGQAVVTMRFAVLVITGMFVFLVTALTLTSQCCRASPDLWITILVIFIILRIIYVLRLHFIAKLCRNDYARKYMMNVNSQQVYSMTSTPMGPTTLPSGTPQRQSEFKNVEAIGFANVTGNDANASGVTNNGQNYGWAV